jgi:hypothetical protein
VTVARSGRPENPKRTTPPPLKGGGVVETLRMGEARPMSHGAKPGEYGLSGQATACTAFFEADYLRPIG